MFKVISGTLLANRNTIEFTDETISNNSIFEVYADQPDVIPVSVTVGGTTVSITFDAKASVNTGIKILVNNIEGEFEVGSDLPDIGTLHNVYLGVNDEHKPQWRYIQTSEIYHNLHKLDTVIDDLAERTLPTSYLPDTVLYHSVTDITWKKLDASNIDYDSGSTIYSAMGDIDDLTTTASNIVGAINEVNNRPTGSIVISSTPVVIGKFDNKNLYCKYITGNIIGGDFTVQHNIENLDLIVDYDVYRYTTDSNKWLWKAYGRGTNRSYNITVNGVNSTEFDITVNGWTSGNLRIIVYYTINE